MSPQTPHIPALALLRERTSEKWRTYPDDVLPMFVAEMDFALAPPIVDALTTAIAMGDTGYMDPLDQGARRAFADFAESRWGWRVDPSRMAPTTDVSVAIVEALRRLVAPGDGVIVTSPVYPPFFDLVHEAGATVVDVPLLDDGHRHGLDIEGIDAALADGARAVLLCNPHNPIGVVHDRATLEALSVTVARHDAVVVSDEIHAPLTHRAATFVPYLTVSDAARHHGIAAVSASKAFNLAGLKAAFLAAHGDAMADLLASLPEEVAFRTGHLGLLATRVGLESGREWLDGVVGAIEANIAVLDDELARHLPMVHRRHSDATYLAWLDMRALGWGDDPAERALSHARVALSSGPTFGALGAGHARMNLACSPDVVREAVARLAAAA